MPDPTKKLSFLDKGIAQVAIIVPNLEEAVENYWKLFGIGDWHFYTYGKPLVKRMTYHGNPSEYKMRVALSYFGPMRVELIEILEGDTVYADFVAEHGEGKYQFYIDKLDKKYGELVDAMETDLDNLTEQIAPFIGDEDEDRSS